MNPPYCLAATMLILMVSSGARALCIYNGIDNAKTTIRQEFKDSKFVVRVKVLSAKDHWSNVTDSWTTYKLQVQHAYKGMPPEGLRFFTYRDSGGFYMDRPWIRLPKGHDVGGEYLLFLNPFPHQDDAPVEAKGAVFVNYPCGVSAAWKDISPQARQTLDRLERGD